VAKDTVFSIKKTWNIRGRLLFMDKPVVMGIINLTPDSFYSESRSSLLGAVKKAEKMLSEGATFLDLGGYSSRPGAVHIDEEEEWLRVEPALREILQNFPQAIISIDTFRAKVATRALDAGASVVNDISGGELDPTMFATIAHYKVPYILMHMRGSPQTMKSLTHYPQLLPEMAAYFSERINQLYTLGVTDLAIDPGFGFAKTLNQNYDILKNLNYFEALNVPLLAGLSRKSMIYKHLNITSEASLNGTTALNALALWQGAKILRVHDVREAMEAVNLVEKVKNPYL
jgi:dihydropteroate synthase